MKVPTLVTILLLCLSFNAAATVWYVDKDNTGAEDGTSWGTAYTTIQPAIDAAYNGGGGEVWIAEGDMHYECSGCIMRSKPKRLTSVYINGVGHCKQDLRRRYCQD